MSKVRTYDPTKIVVICGGEVIQDFVKGVFVRIEMDEERFMYERGLEDGVRIRNINNGGKITLTLEQTSPSNVTLDAFLDEDLRSGNGYFSVLINDANTRNGLPAMVCKSGACWIVNKPVTEYGDTKNNREWVIQAPNLTYNFLDENNELRADVATA